MIGERIKKARILAGLSQKQLGDAVGKGISTISEWESGKRSPDVELIPVLGKILNVSQLFLMDLSDNPKQETMDRIPAQFPTIDEDYALLDAYHSADKKTRVIVKMLLDIYEEDIP